LRITRKKPCYFAATFKSKLGAVSLAYCTERGEIVKTTRVIGLVVILAIIQIGSVQADQQDFIGEWVNVNLKTGVLTRLVISDVDNGWAIHAWGKCHPDDCDWKPARLHILSSSVADRSFKYGFAIWEFGFATKYLTLSKDGDRLKVEVVTIFQETDRHQRSNTKHTDLMRRVE
jgi:hypothetical protein